jgi:hypothetical protein
MGHGISQEEIAAKFIGKSNAGCVRMHPGEADFSVAGRMDLSGAKAWAIRPGHGGVGGLAMAMGMQTQQGEDKAGKPADPVHQPSKSDTLALSIIDGTGA